MNVTVSKVVAGAIVGMALVFAAPVMAERDRHHGNGRGYHQSQHYDSGHRRHHSGHHARGYRAHHGGHYRVDHYDGYSSGHRHGGHHHGSDVVAVVGGALLVGGILHHLAH